MKRWISLALFSFSFFQACTQDSIRGKVIGISDGDSFEILSEMNRKYKVRLLDVDCPEKGQAFGERAKEYTSAMIFQKSVIVKFSKNDRYNRILGDVYLQDSTHLNSEIVKAGYAWRYKHSTSKKLLQLQEEARQARKGLWQDENPVAPWDFRKNKQKPD